MKTEALTILHTADWHIGQLFYEFERTEEHQFFLDWLSETLVSENVDVLLVSGDVFDVSNPSAASIKAFYSFLNKATRSKPGLQVIITAGNHDSASRLEAPKPLLESSNIHIIGLVQKNKDGNIDLDKLIIPLKNNQGATAGWCIAMPFLRMGDYPCKPEYTDPYAEGVADLYHMAFEAALGRKEQGEPIIAMGHLHVKAAEISDLDHLERQIMGGVECLSVDAFHPELRYVALGHIHKAQRVAGKEHIRYSGSPIPLSFAELNYKHQVSVFTLQGEVLTNLKTLDVPSLVPLMRVPLKHAPLSEVLEALQELPTEASGLPPFLEVRVLLDGPHPGLRHQIDTTLKGKSVRLAKIDVRYPGRPDTEQNILTLDQVQDLEPTQVFAKVYASRFGQAPPPQINQLLTEVIQDVSHGNTGH
jgi:DNA repair protein SbcD/Mre11